jgi:hypothetical protein
MPLIMKHLCYFILFALCSFGSFVHAQFSIGTWRDHLPYNKCIDVCEWNHIVYAATPYAVFSYNKDDGEIIRYSKATQLTDIGISALEIDPATGLVIIGYSNGNIDLLDGKKSYNIPDIKFSTIIGDKAIYDILPFGNRVYLSTGFGVVVLDMIRKEVKETYFIGPNGGPVRVNDVAIFNDTLYAATEEGLQKAYINNPFLANFQNWLPFGIIPGDSIVKHIEFFNNEMVLLVPGTQADTIWSKSTGATDWTARYPLDDFRINQIWSNGEWLTVSGDYGYWFCHFNFDFPVERSLIAGRLPNIYNCIVGEYGYIWAADKYAGLFWSRNAEGTADSSVEPDGPFTASCRRIGAYNNNIWIAHGGVRADWGPQFNVDGISGFVDDQWKHISSDTIYSAGAGFNNSSNFVTDVMDVAVDPLDNSVVYAATWDDGLVRVNTATGRLKPTNGNAATGPDATTADPTAVRTQVASVAFSDEGILWCTNSLTDRAIHALDRDGKFYDYDFGLLLGNDEKVGDILIGNNGFIWANVIGKGLLVLNNNGTLPVFSDDNFKLLTDAEGNGKLASNDVLCMEEDLDEEVWVGTSSGLSIFYNPASIFDGDNFDSEQILIEQDGNTQILLETESINCIEIDGSNRKWIGTQNSGVYLLSDDGLRQVYHFTEENSPLLSNTVYDIAINHSNGEVFFATENGVVGFFSTATNFDNEMSNVRVFPNPVRPEYAGNITIDGLAYNTSVKITDIQGNILFETESEGGRAVWDGLLSDGSKPATGVYLVYVSTPLGTADEVRKITIIR